MKLSEIHDCDKCRNKIVSIAVDLMGNTYCGYCHEKVDYGVKNGNRTQNI